MGSISPSTKPNIVVVGGSYVGLKAVELLSHAFSSTHQTILLEKNTHFQHLFAFPRYAILPNHEHMAFVPYDNAFHSSPPGSVVHVRGKVTEVLPDNTIKYTGVVGEGQAKEELIPFEYLVLATGTKLPPPGTLHTEDKVSGIEYFREHQRRVKDAKKIVVVGGGAVGVQMATDIADLYPPSTSGKHVTLIQSRNQLMPTFHPAIHPLLMTRLEELGVEVILGERVKVPEGGFPVDKGEFEVEVGSGRKVGADFVIICTGQIPLSSPVLSLSPDLVSSKTGRILVKPSLQTASSSHPNIFAIGDVAETGGPKQARPGFKQAEIVVENIKRLEGVKEENGEVEVDLVKYDPDPAGIHLTLGMKRNILFRNPASSDGEPSITVKDDGVEDMGVSRVWAMRAPGVTNYRL
ncbi:hypothetical protein JAAARDRAFT_129299 [Jaapia argillacea MUCL 33604]|uniref:FAD/NAD(P)-binding domain-containing protein n=1 Tax=Jaapia argillacea MUCL 33604 TaxID=933084 RepID=A0A067PW77_9AGAM|nr:hypothetical protein JAAARDRAFT_129299 [Jaapia argillacea MUCL 33604]